MIGPGGRLFLGNHLVLGVPLDRTPKKQANLTHWCRPNLPERDGQPCTAKPARAALDLVGKANLPAYHRGTDHHRADGRETDDDMGCALPERHGQGADG